MLGCWPTDLSNAEIAARLFLSVGTVKDHVSAILAKFDVGNRVQASLLAQRAGLLGQHGSAGPDDRDWPGDWPAVPPWVVDLLLVALALADAALSPPFDSDDLDPTPVAFVASLVAAGAVACAAAFPTWRFCSPFPG